MIKPLLIFFMVVERSLNSAMHDHNIVQPVLVSFFIQEGNVEFQEYNDFCDSMNTSCHFSNTNEYSLSLS